jgi:hypothetical protein
VHSRDLFGSQRWLFPDEPGWRARGGLRGGRALIGGGADGNLRMVIAAAALRQGLEETIEQRGRHWKRTLRQYSLVVSRHYDAKVSRYG